MIDWLTILIALVIIAALVSGFGFLAWKMNMSDPSIGEESSQLTDSNNEKRRKEKNASEQSKKKRKEQRKPKRENKDEEEKQLKRTKPMQTSEETDDEREESEQVNRSQSNLSFLILSYSGIINRTDWNRWNIIQSSKTK